MIKTLHAAAEAIKESTFLIITAGSGLVVDAGLPDLRRKDAFWEHFPKYAKLGLTLPEVATPSWLLKDPAFAWGFFGRRIELFDAAMPHEGFQILKSWALPKKHGFFIFTSNINNVFQRAGFPESRIVEVHGNIYNAQCRDNHLCVGDIWPLDTRTLKVDDELRAVQPLPKCKHCGGLARPNTLLFGDWGWVGDRSESQLELFEDTFRTLADAKERKVCVLEIGAGLAVPTVRAFSESFLYRDRGSTVVRINPKDAKGDVKRLLNLPYTALQALKELDELIG